LSSPEEWERFRAGAQGPDGDLVAAYALEDNEVISAAGRLAGSPGVLIHGRLDLSCPAVTAWELARAWPGTELLVDDHSGPARLVRSALCSAYCFANRTPLRIA
jgi:pimeloyl-ACP methyl ester carboxylesterase